MTAYRDLMKTAHQTAKTIRRAGESYTSAFAVALKAAWAALKEAEMETKDGKHEINLVSNSKLSNSGYHRCGGNGSGAARWWLRCVSTDSFVEIPHVRGDSRLDVQIRLAPGKYVLGVGRGKDTIREPFIVTDDGDVVE